MNDSTRCRCGCPRSVYAAVRRLRPPARDQDEGEAAGRPAEPAAEPADANPADHPRAAAQLDARGNGPVPGPGPGPVRPRPGWPDSKRPDANTSARDLHLWTARRGATPVLDEQPA